MCGADFGYVWGHQEASRKEQKLPRTLWDLLATIIKHLGRQVLCLQLSFSKVLWAVWVGASWSDSPILTTNSCHGADAVQQHPQCGRHISSARPPPPRTERIAHLHAHRGALVQHEKDTWIPSTVGCCLMQVPGCIACATHQAKQEGAVARPYHMMWSCKRGRTCTRQQHKVATPQYQLRYASR